MKAVLFTDAKRTKTYGSYEEVNVEFNANNTKCRVNDHTMKTVNRVFTKTVGKTQIRLWSTKVWGDTVYFRQTVLAK